MRIKWSLRVVSGTVVREKDHASVQTLGYGGSVQGAGFGVSTRHGKQLWIDPGNGEIVTARLDHTENVSASPGDMVRVVFAEPGDHVVGLRNETLGTSWKWKFPSPGSLALWVIAFEALALLALLVGGLVALWQGSTLIGAGLLAIVVYVVAVPLGRNRRRVRELQGQRDAMLAGRATS